MSSTEPDKKSKAGILHAKTQISLILDRATSWSGLATTSVAVVPEGVIISRPWKPESGAASSHGERRLCVVPMKIETR